MDYVQFYKDNGYAVIRNVFAPSEIAELARECDRLKEESARHHASFRHKNLLYMIVEDSRLGRILRFVQWPSYHNEILARYRVDPRFLEIVEPLIGNDLKQIINQLIWKPPGAEHSNYGYHQDSRFRRPAVAYRNLGTAYVQTALAIDPHGSDNGCVKVYPGSHELGDLDLRAEGSVYETRLEDSVLREKGLDPGKLVDLILEPGDVALWGPHVIHGSGPNLSNIDRRSYLNSYVVANDCDRGEWAFRNGEPWELGEPVLVQYVDLYQRSEPHYINGPPHPFKGK